MPIPQLDLFKLGELYGAYDLPNFVYIQRCIDNEYRAFIKEENKPVEKKTNGAFGKGKSKASR